MNFASIAILIAIPTLPFQKNFMEMCFQFFPWGCRLFIHPTALEPAVHQGQNW
jgi:hypothetical protein